MSWTKNLTSQPFFNSFSTNLTKLSSNFLELVLRGLKTVISRRPQVANFVDMIKAVITLIETEKKKFKRIINYVLKHSFCFTTRHNQGAILSTECNDVNQTQGGSHVIYMFLEFFLVRGFNHRNKFF